MREQKVGILRSHHIPISLVMILATTIACNLNPSPSQSSPVQLPPTESLPTMNPEALTVPSEDFSIQDANSIAPDDVLHVLDEVASFRFAEAGPCEGYEDPESAEWLELILIQICEFIPGEEIKVTTTSPDGRNSEMLIGTADNDGNISYSYEPSIDEQNGWYIFTFSGGSGQVQHNVYVSTPNEPRMYFVDDLQSYYLYGFSPQERIRFFWYNATAERGGFSLAAWRNYYVDNRGHLLIKVSSQEGIYRVVGDISGTARNAENILLTDPKEFIRWYFTAVWHDRNYDYLWTLLTEDFRGTTDYSGYVEWWNGVNRVDVENVSIMSWYKNRPSVQVQLTFHLKDGTSSTATIDYELIFNHYLGTWQFDQPLAK